MPVATQATVKTLGSEDLEALGFELVLANTYHLALRPGVETIEASGGLHNFMSWHGATLTDSGGYQVMSLSHLATLDTDGVTFKSHLDGSAMRLTPETCVSHQARLNVDISMPLDLCPPYPSDYETLVRSVGITHDWAQRSLDAKGSRQSLFAIVQGGTNFELRSKSAEHLSRLPFEGYAIGGVSVGEPTALQRPVVAEVTPLLPTRKPRYLMGVGTPQDLIHGISSGVDMFDCVLPTRMARHHTLYTLEGKLNAMAAKWEHVFEPHQTASVQSPASRYTAAYLRHLFKTGEFLALRLATLHNLAFYKSIMHEARQSIIGGTWEKFQERYRAA